MNAIKFICSIISIFLSLPTLFASNPIVKMETEKGVIRIEIYQNKAPVTAENFLRYVREGRFNDAVFYRVVRMDNQPKNKVKIEVVQGGLMEDPEKQGLPAIIHENTGKTGVLHEDGVVSMARLGPGTASSEFFICVGKQKSLDFGGKRNPDGQGFAAFGKVIEGMDVVRAIQKEKNRGQMLIKPVKITGVEIEKPQKKVRISGDLTVFQLDEGVYLHISSMWIEGYGYVPANGLLIIRNGKCALIDTPWTNQQTKALLDWAESVHKAQISFAIPCHSHDDCAGGLKEVHARGGQSYALKKTAEFAEKAGNEIPKNSFEDSMALRLGDLNLQLNYLGGAHTADNIVVWIPERRILFGGCMVKSATAKNLGYTKEADMLQWPDTLNRLRKVYPDVQLIIPGHGNPGGFELIDNTVELLSKLNDR